MRRFPQPKIADVYGLRSQIFDLDHNSGEGLGELTATMKNGTIADNEGSTKPENPIWVEFARSMAPMMAMPAEIIAKTIGAAEGKKWKVLDIAAGHGLFGVAIARHNPNAEIVALDWPAVLEVAKEKCCCGGSGESL